MPHGSQAELPAVSDGIAPPEQQAGRFYRPELDALRFFAFFCVFLHHLGRAAFRDLFAGSASAALRLAGRVTMAAFEAGSFGMCLFFLLSAYLITELLLLERQRTGGVNVRAFYARRVLRIWPLYFAFIALMVALGWLWPELLHASGWRIAAFLLLAGNWYAASHAFFPRALSVLWSISVEEQFYLAWPALVRFGRGRKAALAACCGFALISAATLFYLGRSGEGNQGRIWMNSFVQFLFFATGGALALRVGSARPQWSTLRRTGLLLAGLSLWVAAELLTGLKQEGTLVHSGALLAGYSTVAVGTALIFFAFLGGSFHPALRYLGRISYGLYVFHILMLEIAMRALAGLVPHLQRLGATPIWLKVILPFVTLAMTIGAASASYRWLETPFLRLRRRFTVVPSRPV